MKFFDWALLLILAWLLFTGHAGIAIAIIIVLFLLYVIDRTL